MARICAQCRMPVAPVNECLCDDDEPEFTMTSDEDDTAA